MGERVIFQADGKTSQDMSKSNPVQFSSEINTPLLSQSWIPREKTENIESSKKTVHHIISPTIFDRSITFYDFPFPSTFGNSKWFERYERAFSPPTTSQPQQATSSEAFFCSNIRWVSACSQAKNTTPKAIEMRKIQKFLHSSFF